MRSVFFKYLTAFVLIIFVSCLVILSIVNSLVENYSINSKLTDVRRSSDALSTLIEKIYIDSEYDNFDKYIFDSAESLKPVVEMMAINAEQTLIMVADGTGKVMVKAGSPAMDIKHMLSDSAVVYPMVPGSVLDRLIASGTENVLPEEATGTEEKRSYECSLIGTMEGFFRDKTVVSAMAVLDESGAPVGFVLACTPNAETDALLGTMNKTVFMSTLWVMLAALVAIYFITERLVSPLREMSRAAKKFASGQFDVRVNVVGNDEVAELAEAFNNMAGSLATLEEMRRSFLANVSHDLRTPMTTIAGFIDGIIDGAIPAEKQPYYLDLIASEVRRLSRLVSSLLDISRLEAGERKFNLAPFDICELARQIVISFEQKIDAKHLDVEFDCDSDNMMAIGDRDAIYQVMYNLCDNAIKFSNEGGKYRVAVNRADKKIAVSVYNEGEGIRSEDLPFVFDRFYKTDKSRGLDKSGVGLGLYISRTILDAHGEKIKAESEYGKWCRFEFTLRAADKDKPDRRERGMYDTKF